MMRRVVQRGTKLVYSKVAKPVLFLMAPDSVHQNLLTTGAVVQRTPGVKHLPRLWSQQYPEMLQQELMGLTFRNPVGLSAGFDKNAELVPLIHSVGFGYVTVGSITNEPCEGNPRPWFARLPRTRSLIVNAGLPNQGVRNIAERVTRYRSGMFRDFPLAISVAKANSPRVVTDEEGIADYCATLRYLEDRHLASIYEINISCPNTYGGEPFTAPQRLRDLLRAVDELLLVNPVVIKMPIDKPWSEFRELVSVAAEHDCVKGLAIGNLRKDREAVHPSDQERSQRFPKGGISGVPTRAISTALIRKTYEEFGDRFTLIGIGGIFTAEDAYEKICAGAHMTALVTGMIFNGPQIVGEINEGVVKLLKQDGFSHISQAVGSKTSRKSV